MYHPNENILKKILIIEDEEKIRGLLTKIIGLEGFDVMDAADCKTALKKLGQVEVDVVLCDVRLPDGNGVELVKMIKDKFPFTEVILLTAYGNISDSVQAIKNGAFDYITKGDDNNKIIPLLHHAIEKVNLARRVRQLENRLAQHYSFDTMIAASKAMQVPVDLAKKVAETDTTVLLMGETGTGKEVFAQAIHYAGKRKDKPFVALNCAAFSKELLESELFGYKSGSFTGAIRDKKGLFEEADSGTIFLDEIGEMEMDLQAKLLRALETGEFMKIGDTKPVKVDIRIIAATNKDLQKETDAGNFREDLYYRISVFVINLPPLRERPSDIESLALYFTQLFSTKLNKKIKEIAPECMEALRQHPWYGNIRELKNVIERSVILNMGNKLLLSSLPIEIQDNAIKKDGGGQLSAFELAAAEKIHIRKVLNYTNGNKSETARLLNIALTTLYRKLAEYDIR